MLCEMDEAARRIIVTGRGNSDAKGAVTYTLHSDALAEDLVIEARVFKMWQPSSWMITQRAARIP